MTAQQVSQKLGAAYVLEGSIRRSGNRVRTTAQLVEASTRHSVWPNATTGNLRMYLPSRKKLRGVSLRLCAFALLRRRRELLRENLRRIRKPTTFTFAEEAIPAVKILTTLCRCLNRPFSSIPILP